MSQSGAEAASILTEAAEIVAGARNSTHGDKERSFGAIARMWHAYDLSKLDPSQPDTAYDVSQKMVLLKIVRANQGERVRDHAVDQCGYSAIAGELA
jgi:hypothetical protein